VTALTSSRSQRSAMAATDSWIAWPRRAEQTADRDTALFFADDTATPSWVVQDEAASMAMSSALAAVGETA